MPIPFYTGPEILQIYSILATIFMIWMLIDCARNTTLRHKIWWILFIFTLTFNGIFLPIGGIVYFFVRGPWPKVKQYLSRSGMPTYYASPLPKVAHETYIPYEQGYQAMQPESAPTFQESEQSIYAPSPSQPQYEQPQATYPQETPLQHY